MNSDNVVLTLTSKLKAQGVESPRVNAEEMLRSLLGCGRTELYADIVTLDARQALSLNEMTRRRIDGEPLQHITGKANFFGNEIIVREGVFIPRPETEILVETVIKLISGLQLTAYSLQLNILDLCTGSGNIAISLTKELPHCKILSSDISDKAVSTASENAKLHSVSDRIEFIKADLFDIPESYRKSFDIIVCNPPYVIRGDIPALSKEVRSDPREALDGGADGMDFYRAIINHAPGFLKDSGLLALELSDGLNSDVKKLMEDSRVFDGIEIFKDLNGIERVITALLRTSKNREPKTNNRKNG